MAEHKPVLFEDSRGNVFSNDPIWLAQQTLAKAGMTVGAAVPVVASPEHPADDSDDSLDDDTEESPYAELGGKELKALANERGVDITGLTKVGQVRDALTAADEAEKAEEASTETSEDETAK